MARTKTPAAPPAPTWTPQQKAAIEHVGGDLLVSAAAGSGKTAVLAQRCARLVTMAGGTTIDRLLVVTFTEAAATEMRLRIAQELGKIIEGGATDPAAQLQAAMIDRAAISTLHGFCTRTLRAYFHEVGAGGGPPLDPSFEILDADEARLLQDEVLDAIFRRYHLADVALSKERPAAQSAFAALLESHAQGQDGKLKGFILKLHAMLVTLRDPAAWLAAAQEQYSLEGIDRTLADYARHVAGNLRMEARHNRDSLARVRALPGAENLAQPLAEVCAMLEESAGELEQEGMSAWERVREWIGNFEWPTIYTNKDVSDFAMWKDQTVEKAKKALKKLKDQTFAEGQSVPAMRGNLLSAGAACQTLIALTQEFEGAYTAAKRAQNRLDFSDLEKLTLEMLVRPDSQAAADLRRRFDHVLVDEFQDINPLQAALLEAVRSGDKFGGRGNLFAVGDVKQSIYGFRLADPEEFLRLEERLRRVHTHRAFIPLQHNFRTAPHLLAHMNAVFAKLLTRDVAGLDYTADHELVAPPGSEVDSAAGPIELYLVVPQREADDDEAAREDEDDEADQYFVAPAAQLTPMEREARFVAQKIEELIAARTPVKLKDGTTRAMQYRDIAILLRSVKDRALLFSRALAERNIPVHADLATGYFDTQEVRDVLALLAVLDNPYQDIPLATLLLSPIGRFAHDDLARIRLAYPGRADHAFHQAVHQFMLDAVGPDAELAGRLRELFRRLDGYRQRVRVLRLHDALAEMYDDTGLLTFVAGLPGGFQRIANLQALHHRARQFSGFRKQGLYRFLRFVDRLRDSEGDFGEAPVLSEASDVVRILSIHKSKGLEFPVVFVSTLGARFNLNKSDPVTVDRDHHLALAAADVERNIFMSTPLTLMALAGENRRGRAEELRLLYVALTRARNRLILTGAARPDAWTKARERWGRHNGPLPAYHLLRASGFLEYLLPAAAMAGMDAALRVQVEEYAPPAAAKVVRADEAAGLLLLERTLKERRGERRGVAEDPTVRGLIGRLDYQYPFALQSEAPAVYTVTELKKRVQAGADEDQAAELAQLAGPGFKESLLAEPRSGVARGLATHRLLQMLDFVTVDSPQKLEAFIGHLVAGERLTAEEAAAIDRPSIAWFLQTDPGRRMRAAGLDGRTRVLREVPFVYALELAAVLDPAAAAALRQGDRRDLLQLRGVIDVLLAADGAAEILDYKTDAPFKMEEALPMYRQQMRYYAQAVEAALGLRVSGATLVLLSIRQFEPVAVG